MTAFTRETTGNEIVQAFGSQVQGKTVAITGTSDGGLGANTAIALAKASPAHIILLARSAKKVEPVQAQIKEVNALVKTTFVPIELDDLDSVRKAAEQINASIDHLDILINNAGIMAVQKFTLNKHGVESQFATNHVGHFLLTALLFDKIAAAGPGARIVNVTSDGHTISPCRFEDYNFNNGKDYNPWNGYGQSKTANILFTRQLATKLQSQGVYAFAIHPGVIMETSLSNHMEFNAEVVQAILDTALRETGEQFMVGQPKSMQQGISTTLRAALDPALEKETGAYFEDCNVKQTREYATSLENAQRLWTLSEDLVGQRFDLSG